MNAPAADALAMEQQLHAAITAAADRLPRFFPLEAFVASNPLQGFEHSSFEAAIAGAQRLCGGRGHLALEDYRDRLAHGFIERVRLQTSIAAASPRATLTIDGDNHALADYLLARVERAPHTLAPPPALLSAATAACERAGLGSDDGAAGWPVEHTTLLAWLDARLGTGLCARRDALVGAFVPACLLGDDGGLCMPGARDGLYAAFRHHMANHPLLADAATALDMPRAALLPDAAETAVLGALGALGLAAERRADYICQQLFALKGWAAFVSWHTRSPRAAARPARLLDLLAVLLVTERLLWIDLALAQDLPCEVHGLAAHLPQAAHQDMPPAAPAIAGFAAFHDIAPAALERSATAEIITLATTLHALDDGWLALRCLEAEELAYRDALIGQLATREPAPGTSAVRPRAQLAFCIDVRSEPLRRAIEAQGGYETCGYAGFFGVAVSYARLDGSVSTHCPVLLEPAHGAHEQPAPNLPARTRRRLSARAGFAGVLPALRRALKRHPLATFGIVDGFGLLSVWPLLRDAVRPPAPPPRVPRAHVPALGGKQPGVLPALDDDEQLAVARSFFETTGLAAPFARLIVLCGHAASTTNNAYAAALDCGACGGHEGGTNARLLARVLERPAIRRRLAAHGIALPDDTRVVAALHDTTTDRVTLFDDTLPASHARDAAALRRALDTAGQANRAQRAPRLGTTPAALAWRAADGAETRPEWGLAGNAAFICAPRSTTLGCDLDGRTFLHSYDWKRDTDGRVLAAIMTAPLIVAQWINAQYYFSSVDNATWGSGSKVTQNIIGGCAVIQGEGGDLRLGLPEQSVSADDGRLYHQPLRLLALIEAPTARIDQVLSEQPGLRELFDHRWLHLVALDRELDAWFAYLPGGRWEAIPAPVPATHPNLEGAA